VQRVQGLYPVHRVLRLEDDGRLQGWRIVLHQVYKDSVRGVRLEISPECVLEDKLPGVLLPQTERRLH